jgi:hypothetical protein
MMMERNYHARRDSNFAQDHFPICFLDLVTFTSPSSWSR